MNLNETPLLGLELINLSFKPIEHFLATQDAQLSETLIAQKSYSHIQEVDIIADMKNAWDNFIETGQVWALLIGLFFGYLFRSFTSF
jgi:hypothetical protein